MALFILDENDKKELEQKIEDAANSAGTDGGHYTPSVKDNGDGTMTISFTASKEGMAAVNPVTITLPVPADGKDGQDGQDGQDGENGGYYTPSVNTVTANTFKISFTASKADMPSVADVTITLPTAKDGDDGEDGADGVGIESIVQTTTSTADGGENVITVTLTNGNKSTFTIKNGSKGNKGDAGNGIKSIAKTSTSGLVDTYTITLTDDTTAIFTVTNGKDGANGAGEETPFIVLPSELYAVVGHEFVLYYNNILGAMRPEDFAVTTEFPSGSTLMNREEPYIGAMFEWGLRIMPQEKHIGNHTLTIKVFNRRTWNVVAIKSVTLVISEEKAFSDGRILIIGDSLTEACVYIAELERMLNNGIKSVGTLNKSISFNGGTANLNTEGRSGACSYGYVNREVVCGNYTNPFYNPDETYTLTLDDKYSGEGVYASALPVDNSGSKSVISHHFDFAYYMANSGVEEPDAVFINLGSNCGNRSSYKTAYMSFCAMVDRIRAYSATLPIFIHLWPPKSEAGSTDRKASGSVSGWVNKRTYFYEIIQFFIDKFDGDSRVILVPTYTMIDPVYDFKRQTIPVSARNTEQVTLGQSDGIHPDTAGYLHMADSYFNAMMAWLISEEGGETICTVTNNLTNVINSNDADSVKHGDAYTATLTAASGYTLDTVSVTMGGTAVSVSGGTINISSVTGDIVITATAVETEEEPTVVNLVDPSTANDASPNTALFADEWVNNAKLSSSLIASNKISTGQTGIIVTDMVPVTKTQKLRIEGFDISTSAKKAELKVILFTDAGVVSSEKYYTVATATDSSVVDQNLLSQGIVLVTVSALNNISSYPNIAYARISGYPKNGNNASVIVTVE